MKVMILTSRSERKKVEQLLVQLWHTRKRHEINPVYIEDMDWSQMDVYADLPEHFLVVVGLTPAVLAKVDQELPIKAMLEIAASPHVGRVIPLILKPCDWRNSECIFANRQQMCRTMELGRTDPDTFFDCAARELSTLLDQMDTV